MSLEEGIFYFISQTLYYRMAECKVRHKVPVHNVEMKIIGTIVDKSLRFLVELRQIGIKYRWSDFSGQCFSHFPQI